MALPLKKDRLYLFDGSFSAFLTEIGFDSGNHPLWTSGASIEQTRAVYQTFKAIGCEIVSTNTYHASQTLVQNHLSDRKIKEDPRNYIRNPVETAFEVYEKEGNSDFPLVLGSIGPYGTCLRDASEYHGNYVDQPEHLVKIPEYQEVNFELLIESGLKIILYETIPAHEEAVLCLKTLDKLGIPAVISFTCKDAKNLRHGTPLRVTVAEVLRSKWIRGIGINCTDPKHVPGLLQEIDAKKIEIPVFVYPNSGEMWDSERNCYKTSRDDPIDWSIFVEECSNLGANVFGGCCRIGSDQLGKIADAVRRHNS